MKRKRKREKERERERERESLKSLERFVARERGVPGERSSLSEQRGDILQPATHDDLIMVYLLLVTRQ